MNKYHYIVNPITNRKCRVDSVLGKKILKNYRHIMSGGAVEDVAHAVPQGPEYDDLEGYLEVNEFNTIQEGRAIEYGITLSKKSYCDCAPEKQYIQIKVKLYYIDHDDDSGEILYLWVGEEGPYLFMTSVGWLEDSAVGLEFVKSRDHDNEDYEGELDTDRYDWIFNNRDALQRFIETGEQPAE